MPSSPVLLHIYSPCFPDFWHCYSYILQHFNEMFLLHLYIEKCENTCTPKAKPHLLSVWLNQYPTYILLEWHRVTMHPDKEAIQNPACMAIWNRSPYTCAIHNLSLHTWSDWLMLAPFLSNRSTISQCPCWLAKSRGVAPSYSIKCRYVYYYMGWMLPVYSSTSQTPVWMQKTAGSRCLYLPTCISDVARLHARGGRVCKPLHPDKGWFIAKLLASVPGLPQYV